MNFGKADMGRARNYAERWIGSESLLEPAISLVIAYVGARLGRHRFPR